MKKSLFLNSGNLRIKNNTKEKEAWQGAKLTLNNGNHDAVNDTNISNKHLNNKSRETLAVVKMKAIVTGTSSSSRHRIRRNRNHVNCTATKCDTMVGLRPGKSFGAKELHKEILQSCTCSRSCRDIGVVAVATSLHVTRGSKHRLKYSRHQVKIRDVTRLHDLILVVTSES